MLIVRHCLYLGLYQIVPIKNVSRIRWSVNISYLVDWNPYRNEEIKKEQTMKTTKWVGAHLLQKILPRFRFVSIKCDGWVEISEKMWIRKTDTYIIVLKESFYI